ncbi:unannotated protein [freshwater metagenome]|uniref:Unannotated protein n=1 Tax=freshwater metagenome TaxID=449393 RepID=A0A6J7CTN9_9ZZZZ|nr:FxsA family protein [Actinomycetota bacterium]
MPVLLLLLFILVPIAEIWTIIQVGQFIGILPTIALLIADSLLGAWLLRQQGRSAWRRLRTALAEGRVPARETADGALIILGGTLLLTPGFLTDILGVLLLVPPTRALIRRFVAPRLVMTGASAAGGPAAWTVRGAAWGAQRATRTYDAEGTAIDADARELPRQDGPR